MFWLKTRAGFRETNKVEVTGQGGGPVQVDVGVKLRSLDLSDFTDEELALAEKLGLQVKQKDKADEN